MELVIRALYMVRHAAYLPCAVFLAWFCWAQAWQPRPMLWWVVIALGAGLVGAALKWPRSICYWLPASIMGGSLWLFWLPWPQNQFACLGPAVIVCAAMGAGRGGDDEDGGPGMPFLLVILYGCLVVAAALGILSHFVLKEEAAWNELWIRLHTVPLLGNLDRYVGMRHVWVWVLALAFHFALYRFMRPARDVWLLLWSVQWTSVATALLLIWQDLVSHGVAGPTGLTEVLASMGGGAFVLANVLMTCCVLAGHMAQLQERRSRQMVLGAIMALQVVGVVLSGSLMNCTVLVLLGIAWIRPWLKQTWALPFQSLMMRSMVILGAVMLVAGGIWLGVPEHTRATLRTTPVVRLFAHDPLRLWHEDVQKLLPRSIGYWHAAARMVASSPLWGIGSGGFAQDYAQMTGTHAVATTQTHNAYLRVCAEGGLVTAAALVLFLAAVARRLRWCFAVSGRRTLKDCAVMARGFALALAAVGVSSLTTDVWYDTPICIMLLALLVTCMRCAFNRLAVEHGIEREPATEDEWSFEPGHMLTRLRDGVYGAVMLLTWGHAPQIPLRWLAGGILLGGLTTVGFFNSRRECGRIMYEDSLMFGWHAPVEEGSVWGGIGTHATLYTAITRPMLMFSVKALNARAAVEQNALTLFINNAFTASIPLNKTDEMTCYFDVTALAGRVASLRFETVRTYVPSKEGTFADSRPYGALMTPVSWLNDAPTSLVRTVTGMWNNEWTDNAAVYESMGYSRSNRTFRVGARKGTSD